MPREDFLECFASLDYMDYKKNYLVGWQGQFQNNERDKSIILEAIAN
jgi:hypothetical protein